MKTRTYEMIAAAALVIFALVGGIVLNSTLTQDKANSPAVQFPAYSVNGVVQLDLAQQDEIAKTEKYPMIIPVPAGLDLAQMDEVAKLEAYPLTMPASRGELDTAQMDEKAKLEAYPLTMPAFRGELDTAQKDEIAKLEAYPEEHPLTEAQLKSYRP